ncbi:MAG: hypothetical protein JXB47_05995 [Anaerolineae bacterium]|nr:hypothetical protein [Anaerolineae bacterium]
MEPGTIDADISVEVLVERYPGAVGFLVCGEPFWGTLGELMAQKRIENPAQVVEELRAFLEHEATINSSSA